jgi:formyltetrahydrofolate-dependent phosphoribosylglycinamide formyltransferase
LKRIAVFASGRGSNFSAILEQIERGVIPATVACVVSDHVHPPVFDIAGKHDIPTHWVNRKHFSAAEAYGKFLISLLESYQVDLVVLAGFLKLVPAPLVERYRYAMINIHPALLPNFGGKGYYGMKVHEAVIESGIKTTGITIHFVDEHYDKGLVILQEKVNVLSDDTAETLAHRVLELEHRAYPNVVKAICENKVYVSDGKVIWEK